MTIPAKSCTNYLWALLLLLAACLPAAATAQGDLQISIAQDTFGGYYKPGKWFPVVVRISNQPAEGRPGDRSLDFDGSLIVQSSSASGGNSQYNFRHDVSVPAFSNQQFVVYSRIRQSLPVPPTLEVRTATGRRLRSDPISALQALPSHRILMVTVTDQMRRLYYPNPRAGAAYIVEGNLAPGNLFDDWMGYDSVDVLVFPSWPEGRLTARSREALMDWVSMGGTLVFLGGANSAGYAAAEGDNLLPADVNSSSRYALNTQSGTLRLAPPGEDIGDTPSLLLSNMTLRPGAQVLVDAGDTDNPIPALVQQRLGKGRIIFAGADFQSDSLLSRALFAPMWQSVLPLPEPMDWRASLPDALKRTKTVTGRAARPPNLFLVVALCVIYTVIVGPVNFLFLGMTKRIQWAWFTVPAIVLFFTALIYTLGVWTKGGETIARESTILVGYEDDPHFEEISAYSLFVQNPGNYRAAPRQEKLAAADADPWANPFILVDPSFTNIFTDAGGDGLGFAQRRPVIQQTSTGTMVDSWPLRTFDTTQFLARGPHKRPGGVQSTVAFVGQDRTAWLEGELTNNTSLDFYATAIITGNRGISLGAMKAGESISLDRSTTRFWFGQQTVVLWNIWDNVVDVLTARGNLDNDSDQALNRENAAVLLRHIANPHQASRILPTMKGKFYFVGLAEESTISADLGVDADIQARSIIVLVELNPVPRTNSFIVHQDLTSVSLVDFPEDYRFSYDSGLGMRGGFAQAFTPGSNEPMLRLERGAPLTVAFGLPFEHPRLKVLSANLATVELENVPASALFEMAPLGLLSGGGRALGTSVLNDPNGELFTRGRGRTFIQMSTPRPPNQSTSQAAGIRSLGIEVIGGIER
jgi:hypothetical protein